MLEYVFADLWVAYVADLTPAKVEQYLRKRANVVSTRTTESPPPPPPARASQSTDGE